MMATQSQSRSQAEWTTIFDHMQEALALALAQLPEVGPPAEATTIGREPLTALTRSLGNVQACLERAEQCAADADALMQAEAEWNQRWNTAVKAARARLAHFREPASGSGEG